MSSFTSTAIHPIDGDERQCFYFDDQFGQHNYGLWFFQKELVGNGVEFDWDIPRADMEDVIYAENPKFGTKPAPENWNEKPGKEKSSDDIDKEIRDKENQLSLAIAKAVEFYSYSRGVIEGMSDDSKKTELITHNLTKISDDLINLIEGKE